jgi:integrase
MAAALGAESEHWIFVLVVVERDDGLVLHAEPTRTAVPCPVCGTLSHWQHSRYQRCWQCCSTFMIGRRSRNMRDRAFVAVLAATGLRYNAVRTIRMQDYDRVTGEFKVQEKGDEDRTAQVDGRARRYLNQYLGRRPRTAATDQLWVTEAGGALSYWGGQMILRRARKTYWHRAVARSSVSPRHRASGRKSRCASGRDSTAAGPYQHRDGAALHGLGCQAARGAAHAALLAYLENKFLVSALRDEFLVSPSSSPLVLSA